MSTTDHHVLRPLRGARALVTGGGQGIGRAIVLSLTSAGCDVMIHYHSSAAAAAETALAANAHGVRVATCAGDLTKECDAATVVRAASTLFGGIDVLVNNAGDLVGRRRIEQLDLAFWSTVQNVNLTSMMLVTRAALPYFDPRGASIVNLSSLAGRKGGHPGSLAYATAKGAILTWTRALAVELGPRNIRVNAVAPGLILGTRFHTTHTTAESANQSIASIPLGRAGTVDDVARAVTFLASERQGFITGATLDINGGVYAA